MGAFSRGGANVRKPALFVPEDAIRDALVSKTPEDSPTPVKTAHTEGYDAAQPNYNQYSNVLKPFQIKERAEFLAKWAEGRKRYGAVALETGIPPMLIAALHWREGDGDFSTYLHQGDPLGKPAVNEPNDIPVFYEWEPSAIHALSQKASKRMELGITRKTTDLNLLCAFAERYNGYGYKNKGIPSPYVLSGTTGYAQGKYVADGKFDPKAVDRDLGVLPLMRFVIESEAARALA